MSVLLPTAPNVMSLYLSGASLEEVSMARDFITSVLRAEPPDTVATAALLTSELVTNALVHADEPNLAPDPAAPARRRLRTARPFHVTAELFRHELRVLVRGQGSLLPVAAPEPSTPLEESGRGLVLVDTLSHTWGTRGDAFFRTVWFTLPRDLAPTA